MKIYIWGTGKLAKKLLERGIEEKAIEGFIETHKRNEMFRSKKVFLPNEIDTDYDAIIVANTFSNEIFLYARTLGMGIEKMIFMSFCIYINPRENLKLKKRVLGEKNYCAYIAQYNLFEESFFVADKEKYRYMNKRPTFMQDDKNDYPIIKDRYENAGNIHSYFWQDLWAAHLVNQNHPREHYDIGSRVDGFIAHILAMNIPVKMIDIRPFPEQIEGLVTILDDATELVKFEDDSIESLSALCSLEHFGLGRYGDPIDPEACFKCFVNIQKRMKKGGHLYISVPVGKERVQFNAQRIFYASTIVECFSEMTLLEFSCTADGKLEKDVDLERYNDDTGKGGSRFGLFHFIKK